MTYMWIEPGLSNVEISVARNLEPTWSLPVRHYVRPTPFTCKSDQTDGCPACALGIPRKLRKYQRPANQGRGSFWTEIRGLEELLLSWRNLLPSSNPFLQEVFRQGASSAFASYQGMRGIFRRLKNGHR